MVKLTLEKITHITGDVHYTVFLNNDAIWTSIVIHANNYNFHDVCEEQAVEAKKIFLLYKENLNAGLPLTEVLESFEL